MDDKFFPPIFSASTSDFCHDPRRQGYYIPAPLLPGYPIPQPPPMRPIIHIEPQLTTTRTEPEPDKTEPPLAQSPPDSAKPKARMTETQLWKSFAEAGNEMIVTKPGRRLFPTICVSFSGLQPKQHYDIVLRLICADKYRYKFLNGQWQAVGESDILHNEDRMVYTHPNSPNLGEIWMKKPVSFKALKITHHSENTKTGSLLIHTMHKYVAEVDIIPTDPCLSKTTLTLHETTFIAVTSYQSSSLTKLKINNNPFAKGFRDKEGLAPLPCSPGYFASMHGSYPLPPLPPFIPQSFWTPHPQLNPDLQTVNLTSEIPNSEPIPPPDDKDSGCFSSSTPSPTQDP